MTLIIKDSSFQDISRYFPASYFLQPIVDRIKELFLAIISKGYVAKRMLGPTCIFPVATIVLFGMYVYWRKNDMHHLSSFTEFYKDFIIANVKNISSLFKSPQIAHAKKTQISKEDILKKIRRLSLNKKEIVRRALISEYGAEWRHKKNNPATPRYLLNYKSCGANARAVHHLYAEIFPFAYVKRFPLNTNEKLLKKITNAERGIFEIKLYNQHLADQKILGHALIVEKVAQNSFRIYQSFVQHYTLKDYLEASKGKMYQQKQIIRYFDKITLLSRKGKWNRQTTRAFKEAFLVDPKRVGLKESNDEWRRYVTFYRYQLPKQSMG